MESTRKWLQTNVESQSLSIIKEAGPGKPEAAKETNDRVPDNQLMIVGQSLTNTSEPPSCSLALARRKASLEIFGFDSDVAHIREAWLKTNAKQATLETII